MLIMNLFIFVTVIVEQLLLQGVYVGDALLRAVDVALSETVKKICEFAEKMPVRSIIIIEVKDTQTHKQETEKKSILRILDTGTQVLENTESFLSSGVCLFAGLFVCLFCFVF